MSTISFYGNSKPINTNTAAGPMTLRRIELKDIERHPNAWSNLRNNPDHALSIGNRASLQNTDDLKKWVEHRNSQSTMVGIFDSNEKPLGFMMFTETDNVSRAGKIGISIPPMDGKVEIGTAALQLFLEYLTRHLGYVSITSDVVDYKNGSLRQILENSGFKLVGTIPDHFLVGAEYTNIEIYHYLDKLE